MSWLSEVKKIASELSMRHKYIRDERGILEKYYQKLELWNPESQAGQKSRTAGMKSIDITWFMFCLMKHITEYTIDDLKEKNIPEKIKSKVQNIQIKNFDEFFQKLKKSRPGAAIKVKSWMVYALFIGMVTGGIGIKFYKDKENINTENVTKDTKRDKYNVNDADFVSNFVNDNWDKIVIGLLEFETYNETPKLHKGEKRYTYGPGLTWVYVNGEQFPCAGKYKDMASKFSDKEIWDQVRQHCLHKIGVLTKIKKTLKRKGFTEISSDQLLALFLVGYQLPNSVDGIISKLQKAGDDKQKIADAFMAGKEVSVQYRNGTNKRRWWCAMLYNGMVSVNDLVEMDRDAFAHIKIDSVKNDKHFVCDEYVIQNALDCKNDSNNSVRDFILSKDLLKDSEFVISSENDGELFDKVISFNQGIKNIKSKQKNKTINYPLNKEYQA